MFNVYRMHTCGVAMFRIVAVSRSSTMNVERPAMMLSLAPEDVNQSQSQET